MGAWDVGPFDNDDARDWIYDLVSSSDTSVISDAFEIVFEVGDGYLEAPECTNALAAAEILSALRGHPIANMPQNAKEWVEANRGLESSSLVPLAHAAIQRIRTYSELKELWDETDEASKWYATLDDVAFRLHNRQLQIPLELGFRPT